MGDTPYINLTDLNLARQRHREFLQVPELARLVSTIPVWGTWDDHDFALNGQLGDVSYVEKQKTRTAFVDYRANTSYGQTTAGAIQEERIMGKGVYTSFRRGPIEMILLDPRYFSRTEPTFADPSKPTCLGGVQWEWFKKTIKASDATFKIVMSGMVWDDKKNSESDDWETFSHERGALFDLVKDEQIPGVVLLSGDIHVSRALNYGPRVGHDLWPVHRQSAARPNHPESQHPPPRAGPQCGRTEHLPAARGRHHGASGEADGHLDQP